MDKPGEVANPALGQLNKENGYSTGPTSKVSPEFIRSRSCVHMAFTGRSSSGTGLVVVPQGISSNGFCICKYNRHVRYRGHIALIAEAYFIGYSLTT